MSPLCRSLALAIPLGLAACGHGKEAADRRFEELGSQILSLQADQDRFGERLEALERSESERRSAESLGGAPERLPKLRVVRVGPANEAPREEEEQLAEDPPGSESRPVVRAVGQSATVQNLN